MTESHSALALVVLGIISSGEGTLCGEFTYHRRPEFDDKTFTQGNLEIKTDTSTAECFSECFHHKSCNMLLQNPLTRECQLFSAAYSDFTYATSSPGFQYYGAECSVSKSVVTVPVCQAFYAPLRDPSAVQSECYSDGQWTDSGQTQRTCMRAEWIDTTETSLPLPIPVVSGLQIDIRGAQKVGADLLCALRQSGSNPETILLRIFPDGSAFLGVYTGSGWESTIDINPFPVTAGVVFDLRVVFTETNYQVTLNGGALATGTLRNPIEISTYMQMFEWDPLERVKLTYP